MTLSEAQNHVANAFISIMCEEGFETFEEMKSCYWWDSSDIKAEVSSILNETDWYVDEVDGSCVLNDYDMISYRAFMTTVYKLIRTNL